MTTDDTNATPDGWDDIMASFRTPSAEEKRPVRLAVEQDRIKALIENTENYTTLQALLRYELQDLTLRIEYNDNLTGDEDTLDRLRETFDLSNARLLVEQQLMRPEPFYGETVLEIEVPSGKLVIADSLGPVFYPEAVGDINYGRARHETTLRYAKDYKVASAFVGNSCPSIVQQADGSYLVVSLDLDEKDDYRYENGEKKVGAVVTDSWSVELTDYQNWLAHGGQELADDASHGYTVLNVTPGTYRWTIKSHADGWSHYNYPRAEFAVLELI